MNFAYLLRAIRLSKSGSTPIPAMDSVACDMIYRYANGDPSLREAAIVLHRRHIPSLGARGNFYMKFMAEVDNPAPDLALRNAYRQKILEGRGHES